MGWSMNIRNNKPWKDNFSWEDKKEALETRETHITYHGLHPTTSVCSGFVFSCS